MDDVIRRKLNMLIYLAKVDGKFHKSERKLLDEFVTEFNVDPNEFKILEKNPQELELDHIVDKEDMLYLALKIIHADQYLDENEIAFCKDLAIKFNFNPDIVEKFDHNSLNRESFNRELKKL